MVKDFEHTNYWALILGASSGLGFATVKKLVKQGMNICMVHCNSRAQEDTISTEFQDIKNVGVEFKSFNMDAFKTENRTEVISELENIFGDSGKIRTLVHSVAKGNLKPCDQKIPQL